MNKGALVVGLNNYKNAPLNCCVNDAQEVERLLSKNEDGIKNFDTKLIVGECNKGELESKIKKLFSSNGDVALLYFSGHGADNGNGYLCTTDICNSNLGVRVSDIIEWASDSKCKHKIIILDCCFAGGAGNNAFIKDASILCDNLTIMAACSKNECSLENDKHGIFTQLLLDGLKGGAADLRGCITAASLYTYIDSSLGFWEQRPMFKASVSEFLSLRSVKPKIDITTFAKLVEYFTSDTSEYNLDPSYEFTNDPDKVPKLVKPYAIDKHIKIFKDLQLFESVGIVEPIGEKHMYFAAMNNKSCKLTRLGQFYWKLAKDGKITK